MGVAETMGRTPSEGLPNEWLLDRLDRLETRLLEHSRNVRQEVLSGMAHIEQRIETRATEILDVRDRVLTIETQRAEEAKQIAKRGTMAGILAASMLTAGWELSKRLLGWK